MGILKGKQGRAEKAGDDASRAIDEGRKTFLWQHRTSMASTSMSGAAEAVDEIEELGWKLAHVTSYFMPDGNLSVTTFVFRR